LVNPSQKYWRQLDLINAGDIPQIRLIGCGGIGSPAALALAKMGASLTLFDDDTIELHNIPNQMLLESDIGQPKAESLARLCMMFNQDIEAVPRVERVMSDTHLSGVVISGVDSMKSRVAIWERVKMNAAVPWYIEARMSALVGIIYAVKPTDRADIEFYESKIRFTDEESQEDPCTARSIIFNTFSISWVIGSHVRKITQNRKPNRETIIDSENLIVMTG
jgi:hypothetical protein